MYHKLLYCSNCGDQVKCIEVLDDKVVLKCFPCGSLFEIDRIDEEKERLEKGIVSCIEGVGNGK